MASNLADVYVKLPSGRVTKLDLLPSSRVKDIYQRVADEERCLEAQVKIKYTGKVLKKTDTISYLGICKETILKAEITTLKKITITIKNVETNTTFPVTLDNVASVKILQENIKCKEDIAPSKQVLKFGGMPLTDGELLLSDLKVTDNSVVELKVRTRAEPEPEPEVYLKKTTTDNDDDVVDEEEMMEQKEELFSSFHTGGRNIEVVFSFDTTGSMFPCLTKVRSKLEESVRRLLRDIPKIRIGIMAMGDYCDYSTYVVKMKDLTTDVQGLVDFVNQVPATGGGDSPEAYEWVLHKAQQLDWSEDSAKALVVIGDDVPHAKSYTDQKTDWHEELDILGGMGVKVYGVQALNQTENTPFYEELADRTSGAHLKFQHFDLITDMFLAVCYKESSPEQLQNFCEEVEQEGRMTEEAKDMFEQLEKAQKADDEQNEEPSKQKRYVKQPWWDPKLDKGKAQYFYNADTDKWSPEWKREQNKTKDKKTEESSAASSSSLDSPLNTPKPSKGKGGSFWKKCKRTFSLRRSKNVGD